MTFPPSKTIFYNNKLCKNNFFIYYKNTFYFIKRKTLNIEKKNDLHHYHEFGIQKNEFRICLRYLSQVHFQKSDPDD